MNNKISWDKYFMDMVNLVATKSPCLRRQVGAVVVKDHRILTTGYNGPPSGVTHCTPETCIRTVQKIPSGQRLDLCIAVHAEQNSIIQAAYTGISVKGSTLYTTGTPCSQCTKMILNSGISKIVVSDISYNDGLAAVLWSQRPDVKHYLYNPKNYKITKLNIKFIKGENFYIYV